MGPYQAVTGLVSKWNKSLSDYAVSGFLLTTFKTRGKLCGNEWLHRGERHKSSMSSAALAGSRGLTPKKGALGSPVKCQGAPPTQTPPVCRRAVSVGQAGCHVHVKSPCPRAFLIPSDSLWCFAPASCPLSGGWHCHACTGLGRSFLQCHLLLQHVSNYLQSLLRQRRHVRERAPCLYNDAQLLCFPIMLILLCRLLPSARSLTKSWDVALMKYQLMSKAWSASLPISGCVRAKALMTLRWAEW